MRFFMAGIVAVSIVATWGSMTSADVVVMHYGAADPTSEGLTGFGTAPLDQAVAQDSGYGNLPAWKIGDPTGGASRTYGRNLSLAEMNAAKDEGWKLTARVRVDGAGYNTGGQVTEHPMYVEFGSTTVFGGHWGIRLGSDDAGVNTLVNIWGHPTLGSQAQYQAPGLGYHVVDLVDPTGSGQATLYIDGVRQAGNVAALYQSPRNRVVFGDAHTSPEGNANYNYVAFQTGPGLSVRGPNVLYTLEGDSGTTATDSLLADAGQDGTAVQGAVVDTNPSNAAFGSSSLSFPGGVSASQTVEIANSTNLGAHFTLAAMVNPSQARWQRLFSSYPGSGSVLSDALILDFDPSGTNPAIKGMRANVNGINVRPSSAINFSTNAWHHLAMTYNDGQVKLYLDGTKQASAPAGSGQILMNHNLLLGEDQARNADEQFIGHLDDVLVYNEVLQPSQINALSTNGAENFFSRPHGILYAGDGDLANHARDRLPWDGRQDATPAEFVGDVQVVQDPANAAFGGGAIHFGPNKAQGNVIELPETTYLGSEFTIAAMVKPEEGDVNRLFAAYDGGSIDGDELIFDFNPAGDSPWVMGLRFYHNGTAITPTSAVNFTLNEYHHLAAVYDDGFVSTYLDGALVASGWVGNGPVQLYTNLTVGEDVPKSADEQFVGWMDDVLVWRAAMSPNDIRRLAENGALSFVPEPTTGLLLLLGGMLMAIFSRRSRRLSVAGTLALVVGVGAVSVDDARAATVINEWHAANDHMPGAHPGFYERNTESMTLAGGVLSINDAGSTYPSIANINPFSPSTRMFPNDAFSETEDFAVAFRQRVESLGPSTIGVTARLIADDGNRHVNVSWITEADGYKVALYDEGPGGVLAKSDPVQFDVTEWHNYVLEKKLTNTTPGSTTGTMTLYADGQALLSAPYESFTGTALNRLVFGTGSSTGDSHTQWSSLVYNPSDNWLPTPSPTVDYNAPLSEPILPDGVSQFPWTHHSSAPSTAPHFVDGAVRLEVAGGYNRYYRDEPDILLPDDSPNNFIVEWRMRLSDELTIGPRIKVDEAGGRRVQVVFRDNWIRMLPEGPGSGTEVSTTAFDTSQWHTYRLIRSMGANTVDLFVDDMSAPVLQMPYTSYGAPSWLTLSQIDFGWSNSAAAGWADFEYFKYRFGTTTFVPEPGAILLMLVGVAGFGFGRRRRRRA